MAEGFLKSFDPALEVHSAGTRPEARVNPNAVMVMKEVGIDISKQVPDPLEKYLDKEWDYVITVCDNAREACAYFPGKAGQRLHMGFEDPAAAVGSEEEVLAVYRSIRDGIKHEFFEFYNKVK